MSTYAPVSTALPAWSWEEIWTAIAKRREQDSLLFQMMIAVRDRANGDVVVPLPNIESDLEEMSPPIPQLITDVIDSIAMRAGSVTPTIYCPPLDAMKQTGHSSIEFASIRRRALYGSWHKNALRETKLPRAFRQLVAYGSCCFVVMPDYEMECARIEIRDALSAYPQLRSPEDTREPTNCGFVYGKSASWILKNWGHIDGVSRLIAEKSNDIMWDCVEWIDERDIVIGILGPRTETYLQSGVAPYAISQAGNKGMEIKRYPNRVGMVPVAIPRRVTLDRVMGQVSHLIPGFDLYGRMMALDVLAAERGVFPDMVVVGQGGRMPSLQGGQWRDGRTGEINVLLDGDAKVLQSGPGPLTQQTLSMLERNFRMSSGSPGMMSGELTGSLRSGQTVNSLASYSVDPRIAEVQLIMARALTVVNQAVIETEKAHWPDQKYVCFSGLPGDTLTEYVPSKHLESPINSVIYPMPGLDAQNMTVAVAQLNGAKLLPKKQARVLHPFVYNAEQAEEEVNLEAMEEAALTGFLQQLVSGQLPFVDAVEVMKQYGGESKLVNAFVRAQEAAQKRQASQAEVTEEGIAPGAQPGLSMPGVGVEQQPPAPAPDAGQEGPPADLQQLRSMIVNLRSR